MSLFNSNNLASAEIDSLIEALEDGQSREAVKQLALTLQQTISNSCDVFFSDDEQSRRSIIDFIDESIEELQDRKKELDTKTLASLANDIPVYGFELKEGRITRKVSDQKLAEQLLTEHIDAEKIHETKLIGIPAMEKLLKAKGMKPAEVEEVVSQFISIQHGKPVLAKTQL